MFALPAAGLAIGALYAKFGATVVGGNNLVIDTIHDGGPEIPARMLPMVLVGTVLTHLFGGSAGREGTAVQMGASAADWIANRLRLDKGLRRAVIAAGVAGGFGSVFGTPIAGAIFGLEFITLGAIEYEALAPALVASVTGDLVCRALGTHHTIYPIVPHFALDPLRCAAWLAFGLAVAVVAAVFIELTHALKRAGGTRWLGWRMAVGGAIVVGLWQLVGTSDYLGIGVPSIVHAFSAPVPAYAFALKLVFTAVTLGAGFLGGEVTPLFFIGATLGAVIGPPLGIPQPLAAGVGMAAMFAAASNTPLALSVMAVELLGGNALPHVVIVCVVAYLAAGHRSIYPSQRIARGKLGGIWTPPVRLREL
ncbi:MAG TPA: chloride channel protein [Kofleriaceae bacterium]